MLTMPWAAWRTATDSRTGTTTYSGVTDTGYTPSGNLLGMKDAGRLSKFAYDALGRRLTTRLPDTTVTHTSYTARGEVEAQWGSQTYPTFRTYDEQGRLSELHTWQDDSSLDLLDGASATELAASSTTTWNYDSQRGWLENKRDNAGKGADYTYTPAGRLETRTWARIGTGGNRILTTYGYDHGMLESVTYANDPVATPNLAYTYDSFGRLDQVRRGGVLHADYGYASGDLVLLTEQLNIETINRTLTRTYEDGTGGTVNLRPKGYSFTEGATTWTYDSAGRPSTLTAGADAWTYGYRYDDSGSHHLGVITGGTQSQTLFSIDGPQVDVILEYDETRQALLSRKNTYPGGTGTLSKFSYSVNAIGQRDNVTPSGDAVGTTTLLSWDYNAQGEVTSADRAGTSSFDRTYTYDAIGNRLTSTDQNAASTHYSADKATPTPTSGANALNQYARVTYPNTSTIDPVHDFDGNMTAGPVPGASALTPGVAVPTDADLTWDAENRLIEVNDGTTTVSYQYDYLGRRMSRDDGTTVTHYLYDGWNCIAEYGERSG